jgi:hypothetical protein
VVAPVIAGVILTFIVLRIGARWGVDRYLRYGLAAVAVTAVVATRLAGSDDFTAGYWGIGFAFGAILHSSLPTGRRPSAE